MKIKIGPIILILVLIVLLFFGWTFFKNKTARTNPSSQKIIYYRNPMDPSITSPGPMKDSMGMDYVPVYQEPEEVSESVSSSNVQVPKVNLTPKQIELSGIKTEKVIKRNVFKEIRAVGKIASDPEMLVTQEELIIALENLDKIKNSSDVEALGRARELAEGSEFRLKVMGLSDEQILELKKNRRAQFNLVLPEDKVWVYANIYEFELSWIKEGLPVKVTAVAYPSEEFFGRIKSVSPVLDPDTRSVKIRMEINNPGKKLKPEMFVDVLIAAGLGRATPVVSREAVLDTGTRKIVWLDQGGGLFVAREIKTGPEGFTLIDNQKVRVFPVTSGLAENDLVVTRGNFLIDSQSQLTGGMSVLWGGASEKTAPVETKHDH